MNLTEPEMTEMRLIPRLVDTDGQTAVPRVGTRDENLNPGSWTCDEVAQFLEINEIKCDPLVEAIIEQVSFFAFKILIRKKSCLREIQFHEIFCIRQKI